MGLNGPLLARGIEEVAQIAGRTLGEAGEVAGARLVSGTVARGAVAAGEAMGKTAVQTVDRGLTQVATKAVSTAGRDELRFSTAVRRPTSPVPKQSAFATVKATVVRLCGQH